MKHHFGPILMNLICPFFKKNLFRIFFRSLPLWNFTAICEGWRKPYVTWTRNAGLLEQMAEGQRSGCAWVEQWCELETPQKTNRVTTSLERGRGSFIYQSDKESCGEGAPASLKGWMWGTPLSLMPVGDSQRRRWMEWALEERWGEQEDLGWSTHPSGCPTWRSIRGSRSIKTSTLLLAQK